MSMNWPNENELTDENFDEYKLTEKWGRVEQINANWFQYKYELI